MTRTGPSRLALPVLFFAGLALSVAMLLRSQPGGDAMSLLAKGWLLAREGIWIPFGNLAGGGGCVPGSLTSALMGLPLILWLDHRAPIVLVLVLHVVAYLLLDRVVREACGSRARVLLALFYWLGTWRMYSSAWVDNSNYVFLTGAVHLWACWRQRERPSLWVSAALVATVGLTFQLHLDALIPVLAAVLLWIRGYWKPHWGGVALGAGVCLVSLVPFALAAANDPALLPLSEPEQEGFVGLGFVRVWPLAKGASYLLRYASLGASSREMLDVAFAPTFGPGAARLDALGLGFLYLAGVVTLLPALAASLHVGRRLARARRAPGPATSSRLWLAGYTFWSWVGCLLANGLSPVPVMWWHNMIMLHAAVLPLVLWGEALLRSRHAPVARRGLQVYAGLAVLVLALMAVACPHYRPGGRDGDRKGPWTDRRLLAQQRILEPLAWETDPGFRISRELGIPDELPEPPSGLSSARTAGASSR